MSIQGNMERHSDGALLVRKITCQPDAIQRLRVCGVIGFQRRDVPRHSLRQLVSSRRKTQSSSEGVGREGSRPCRPCSAVSAFDQTP